MNLVETVQSLVSIFCKIMANMHVKSFAHIRVVFDIRFQGRIPNTSLKLLERAIIIERMFYFLVVGSYTIFLRLCDLLRPFVVPQARPIKYFAGRPPRIDLEILLR